MPSDVPRVRFLMPRYFRGSTAMMKIQLIKLLLVRLIAVALVFLGVTSEQCGFYLLLVSGIILGGYYGWYNDMIWRPNGKLENSLPYRAHQVWIHIISGVTGSVALYLLLGAISLSDRSQTLEQLNWSAFILFLIAILGYTGLLPRILWFFTYAKTEPK